MRILQVSLMEMNFDKEWSKEEREQKKKDHILKNVEMNYPEVKGIESKDLEVKSGYYKTSNEDILIRIIK